MTHPRDTGGQPPTDLRPAVRTNENGAHTPGPWRVEGNKADTLLQVWGPGAGDFVVNIEAEGENGPYVVSPEMEANARLIAAAPDLYETGRNALNALRQMHSDWMAGRPVVLDRGVHDALEAAIAKAVDK